MPKKSTRHAREPGLARSSHHRSNPGTGPEVKAKHLRSVHIGVSNGKRWLSLKKRLGLSTDEDVAVYLLDLAESVARQEKCNGRQKGNAASDEKHKEETIPAEVQAVQQEDEPLRRSLRKQNGGASPVPRVSPVDTAQSESLLKVSESPLCAQRGSRPKHHKNKTRHRKDKRKKRRHLKVVCDNSSTDAAADRVIVESELEEGGEQRIPAEGNDTNVPNASLVSDIDTKSNLGIDDFVTEDVKSVITKTEHVDSIDLVDTVNTERNKSQHCHQSSNAQSKKKIERNGHDRTEFNNSATVSQKKTVDDESDPDDLEETVDTTNDDKTQDISENGGTLSSIRHKNSTEYDDCNVLKDVDLSRDVEDRKSKKKRKRPRYDLEEEEENTIRDFSDELPEDNFHKHRKKKHRHTGEHKSRKRHDVRKAPQDGLVTLDEGQNATSVESEPVVEKAPPDTSVDGSMTEPQRLAIKIKLCQDCNSRHLQDACPLTTPLYAIPDCFTYEDWLARHKDNAEVINATKSDDPMSEGYGKQHDDYSEADDDSGTTERNKSKSKAQKEERQLTMDVDRPLYARDSLPECFELRISNSEHGLGVFAKAAVPMYVKFGPLVGRPVREMDIPDDFPMRHIWEIDTNGKTLYVSTTNPVKSNWIRYIRPAETKEERSVAVITKEGELHLVTTQNIVSGMELTYWADSQSSAWTRKNKVDKTNCGGCNLNFAHPIYYRLHCCIFHDTNYSLTIRKYHCKVCGAAVLGKDNIMKHAAELHAGHGAYQCQYCKKFFLRLNYLEMHRTYGCAQNPQRSRPLCDFCGRKFCQPQKLKVHIKRMHSDMSEVLREFQCKLCLKLLGSRAALQRHMKEVHHKDVVGAATCDRCGKMFQNKSNLKIHMLTHSGVKPFKCKESACKAAFTTKQCLQFHYKKVHGLTEEMMPKIERSVAYTFDAYSGGLVEDAGRGKTPRPTRRNSQDNSNSLPSIDECSSESTLKVEPASNPVHSGTIDFQNGPNLTPKYKMEHEPRISTPSLQGVSTVSASITNNLEPPPIETSVRPEVDLYSSTRLQSKGSKKWLGEFNPHSSSDMSVTHLTTSNVHGSVYEFEDNRKINEEKVVSPSATRTQTIMDSSKLGLSVYRRTESASASLLVEAALDAAERDIGAVSSPILEDSDRDGNLYSISSQLQSPIPPRTPNHLDSYIQQQEELMSPTPTPDNRHTPPSHLHVDYHLHRPCVDYITTARTHNIDQYLHHEDMPRVSSPNNYMHMQQEDLVSPAGTPNPRYQDVHHHHQVTGDNLSSDEGDSVAQNLSLSVKEKTLQLDLSAPYKYDPLEQEFARERANFEPLVLNSAELQGLDMSARGFHHGFGAQVQNARYHHHHHHLYEIAERQSVDLSRTGTYSISPPPTSGPSVGPGAGQGPGSSSGSPSAGTMTAVSVATAPPPPPPPPPYPHNDVLRVVSLDLTPGGRHSVDLSLSRTHHLHTSASARVITSPQPPVSTTPHAVPDGVEGRILSPPPPPPPLSGYNPSYPVSPAPYHPPRPGYHHYTGYY